MVSNNHNKRVSQVSYARRCAGPRPTAAGLITAALALCIGQPLWADEPAVAIKGGDLYTITSGVIKNGIILVKDGKISQTGQDLEIPEDVKVVDATGKVVMPGFVVATTRSLPVFDSDSEKIAESLDPFNYSVSLALASGVRSMFVGGNSSPFFYGGTSGQEPIKGTNAVIKPTYGDLESMLVKEPVVENLSIAGRQWRKRTEFILKMRQARDYLQLAVLELVDEFRFRLVIEDAVEAWTVAEEIARRDVALIITPRGKRRPNDQISRPSGSSVQNGAIPSKAGVKFAIVPPTAGFETWGGAGSDDAAHGSGFRRQWRSG